MPLTRMEHYLVLSDDIDETKEFYCGALGMREGFRPKLEFPGYWLYVGDTPCIHIAEWRAHLASRGISPAENLLDDIGLRQLFLYDPNGVAIELNFRS